MAEDLGTALELAEFDAGLALCFGDRAGSAGCIGLHGVRLRCGAAPTSASETAASPLAPWGCDSALRHGDKVIITVRPQCAAHSRPEGRQRQQ